MKDGLMNKRSYDDTNYCDMCGCEIPEYDELCQECTYYLLDL